MFWSSESVIRCLKEGYFLGFLVLQKGHTLDVIGNKQLQAALRNFY